ncbi:uncharacterized protein LOC129748223 [Uranotaenia lowii]|uniref:uncharacterized protein LOC129748223 n=1 Tax=Uranotaenia lowii TaxID=190385 RepID=UPI002479E3D4|nr:uncharacterized protein LOC129748223 [Uranotaenia lowii]
MNPSEVGNPSRFSSSVRSHSYGRDSPNNCEPLNASSSTAIYQKQQQNQQRQTQSCESDDSDDGAENVPDLERYVRLSEEHVEAVVILKNEFRGEEPTGTGGSMDALLLKNNNGKLTFNLTPAKLGNMTGFELVCDTRKSSSAGSICLVDGKGVVRKSSLRRNSLYNNQFDLERQLLMDQPKPLPEVTGMYDIPKRILMPMFSEDQDFMDLNKFYDKKSQLKFDEILTMYDQFPTDFLPGKYKCAVCKKLCHDPRVLDCLHTFCKRCLIELDAASHSGSNLFWRRINQECGGSYEWDSNDEKTDEEKVFTGPAANCNASAHDSSRANDCVVGGEATSSTTGAAAANQELFSGESRFDQIRASFQSFRERNCLKSPSKEKFHLKELSQPKVLLSNEEKLLVCPTCRMTTELPLGGINRLPPHFVMARKIEDIVSACGNPPPNIFCELCSTEVAATSSCSTCSLKLCNFCKEAHQRQRNTSSHIVRTIGELLLKKSRRTNPTSETRSIKCPMHPEHQLKLFCTTCHQVICNECTTFIHRDHKSTSAAKACKVYSRFVRNAIEQTRPLEDFAMQSVARLNDVSIRINSKCESVQRDVEAFIDEYISALEDHRKALLKQIADIREAKMEMIIAQKADLEQRSQNAHAAVDFAEEIISEGNEIENLVFISILLRRFEQCLKSNRMLDFKVTDSLEFLPEEQTPNSRVQSRIPLYGVITTQKADPKRCTLENGTDLAQQGLKVHRKVDLSLVTKDYDDRTMAHGGLIVQTDLRYRDEDNRTVPVTVTDNQNGTYRLAFVPERAGVMHLMVSVDGKVIEVSSVAIGPRRLIAKHMSGL